jgi:hypothetical protein
LRVGVLSDTHGKLRKAAKAIRLMGDIELLLHAGDYYKDAIALGKSCGIKVKAVAGNCDLDGLGPVEELLEVGNYRLYLTHGHLFGVKRSLTELCRRAEELNAQIVIYGHTHRFHQEQKKGILFLNPGSITLPRIPGRYSFSVLDFEQSGSGYKVESRSI